MSEQWQFYPCSMGDNQAFIFFDEGIEKIIDQQAPSELVRIALTYQDPHPTGLPKSIEFEAVSSIEDRLKEFAGLTNDWYVGRITVSGYRYFYIYTSRSESEWTDFSASVTEQTGYEFVPSFRSDPTHEGYWQELYPTEDDRQVIKDLQVIEILEKHGDDGSVPRKVDHWIYFTDPCAATSFKTWLENSRFKSEPDLSTMDDDGGSCVRVSHHGTIKIGDISSHSIELGRQAKKLGGSYDGWEAPIIKKND